MVQLDVQLRVVLLEVARSKVVNQLWHRLELSRLRESIAVVLADDSQQLVLATLSHGEGKLSGSTIGLADEKGAIPTVLKLSRDLLPARTRNECG